MIYLVILTPHLTHKNIWVLHIERERYIKILKQEKKRKEHNSNEEKE